MYLIWTLEDDVDSVGEGIRPSPVGEIAKSSRWPSTNGEPTLL